MLKLRSLLLVAMCGASALAAVDPAQLAAARALHDAPDQAAEAQQAFEKIAAADPQCAEAQYFLAEYALRRDDAARAIPYAEKAVALAPGNADYQHALGDAYGSSAQKASVFSQFGLAKKCLACYQRAAELNPAKVEFHQSLFEYYRQAPGLVGGGTDKAEAEAAAIVKLDPISGHSTYATLYAGQKQFDKALDHAAEVKKLDPTRGRLTYAALYTEMKQYDKALAEFDEELKSSPDNYNALYQIGRLTAISGQFLDRGLASLRHCLELTPAKGEPSHAAAQWRLGNILEKKNDPAGARAAYEASLKLDPKFSQAAAALKKLK